MLLGIFLFRAELLRGFASLLIAETPSFQANYLLLLGGDDVERRAAQEHFETGSQILLVQWMPNRLETYGVIPSGVVVWKRELKKHGVAEKDLSVLPERAGSIWEVARQTRRWLQERPDARILLLSDRFDTRRLQYIFGRVLGDDMNRLGLSAVADRNYDETNWWRRKNGLLDFLGCSLQYLHTRVVGEEIPGAEWDPDAYERALK